MIQMPFLAKPEAASIRSAFSLVYTERPCSRIASERLAPCLYVSIDGDSYPMLRVRSSALASGSCPPDLIPPLICHRHPGFLQLHQESRSLSTLRCTQRRCDPEGPM